ncbi:MAG: SAM-dependent methyltransferase, partial [uncultured bacterium]
ASLLKPNGVLAFEDPYLGAMISKTSYDQLYDEHVFIFSAHSVQNAFARHGLELFHVQPLETHGGSMRYYLSHKGAHKIRDSVHEQLSYEKKLNLDNAKGFIYFKNNCEKNKFDLVQLLQQLKSQGKRVVGYAATSKSTTILNYCKIGSDLIEYICDTTPIKQNKYSPGMHIPVKPYEAYKNDFPDYAILFAWNHAEEIMEKESAFIKNGGKWILFVPKVGVLND